MHYIGFDIGGTNVKAALVKDKKIIESKTEKLPDNLEGLLDLAAKIASEFTIAKKSKSIKINGAGFAVPGPLDIKRKTVLNCPNIQYLKNAPFKKLLERKLKLPIKIEHDVHCFLLAETIAGAAKNFQNVFYITLGTGVGGAWMYDGKIYFGANAAAGEIGHTIIKSKIKVQNSKLEEILELEDLASNKIFQRLMRKNAEEVFELARKGDEKAREIFQIMGENLGLGLANLINILDPSAIILGGGISKANEFFLPSARKIMSRYIISPLAVKNVKILVSKLPLAGALGAAFLFQSKNFML